MSEQTIGDRVREALTRTGWQQNTLAEQADMGRDKLNKSLVGVRAFTSGELAQISDLLGVDIYWLISGQPHRYSPRVAFRHSYDADAQEHTPPTRELQRALDQVTAAYTQAGLDDDDKFTAFRTEVGADTFDPSSEDANPWKGMRKAATAVRRRWREWIDAGYDPVADMSSFLRDTAGVDLVVIDGNEASSVQTYALSIADSQVIVVTQTGAWYSAVFGIFHELAHHLFGDVLWEGAEQPQQPVHAEALANGFAANVLLDYGEITNAHLESAPVEDVANLLWNAAAGMATLRYRCGTTRCTAPDESMHQGDITAQWEHDHPREAEARMDQWRAPRFPERLIERHEQLARSGDIPPDMLAWMLQLPVQDVTVSKPAVTLDDDTRKMLDDLGIPA